MLESGGVPPLVSDRRAQVLRPQHEAAGREVTDRGNERLGVHRLSASSTLGCSTLFMSAARIEFPKMLPGA